MLKSTQGLLLALFAGSSLYANIIGTPQAEFRQSYSLTPNGRVVIQNLYGDVRITAWDRDEVLVQAVKNSRDPKRLDDARIVVDSSSDFVSIRTQYAGADAEHPASVDYRIMVPRSANLENVKLINGGLSITGMAGPIKASSVNGGIRAERLTGQADLSTINGRLDAEFYRVNPMSPISLTSVNGAIRLLLPAGVAANLEARNLSGGIDTDFGRSSRTTSGHKLRTVLRHGGAPIHLHNVNGGISIHALRS